MATKKRCDFCLKIKADNLHENDKILDKDLRTLLVNATNIDATPAQLSSILICYDCGIGLAHAAPIMVKARILLTKVTTRRIIKKRKNEDSSAGITLLENGGGDNTDVEHEENEVNNSTAPLPATPKTPKPIVQRRKSVASAKKIINTPLGDEMSDSPVASSTLAIITEPKTAIKSTKKTPIKKQNEPAETHEDNKPESNFNIKLPKSVQQRRKSTSEKNETKDAKQVKKPAAVKKILNGKNDSTDSPAKIDAAINSSSSASSAKITIAASPAKTAFIASPQKTFASPQIKLNNKNNTLSPQIKKESPFKTPAVASPHKRKLFAKFSDDEITSPKTLNKKQRTESENYSSSQDDNKTSKVCNNCGKKFQHEDRYLAHVESKKCSSAAYECKDLNCSRRFHQLAKMYEHMKRKHPELTNANNDSDDD